MLTLDHVQLAMPTGGEEEARRFYGGVLGLREIPKPTPLAGRGGVWFELEKQQLHLGVEESFISAAKAHPGFGSADLAALAERLAAGGFPVTWDDNLPGRKRFYSRDPFGNRLEFLDGGPGSSLDP
ncbi:MAG: VOC family protein [Trueperaceae bacterium]